VPIALETEICKAEGLEAAALEAGMCANRTRNRDMQSQTGWVPLHITY
jgi:hypothetical protein